MYLKNIEIRNTGPIESLDLKMKFNSNESPRTTIFVGPNGSGKTILLSSIVDSLHEIAASTFRDVLKPEGLGHQYYRLSGGVLLQNNKTFGYSALRYSIGKDKIDYLDFYGKAEKFKKFNIPDFSFTPAPQKKQLTNAQNKPKLKDDINSDFANNSYIYFPADRKEVEFWRSNIDKISQLKQKQKYINYLDKKIEVTTQLDENISWLLAFIHDFYENRANPTATFDRHIWESINEVLQVIKKKDNIRLGFGNRQQGLPISIVELDDKGETISTLISNIDQLSLGEKVIFNMFMTIIRYSDNPNIFSNLGGIKGIVVIDEIEMHLHPSLQYELLPKMIQLFPNIQFIITTHSPLVLLGLEKATDNFDIYELPFAKIISTEKYSEFEKAYKYYKDTNKYEEEIEKTLKQTQGDIIFCEGETDPEYIQKADKLFNPKKLLEAEIRWIGHYNSSGGVEFGGDKNLNHLLSFLKGHRELFKNRKIILLYDFDTNKQDESINNVFIKCLQENKKNKKIRKGIENLFPSKLFVSKYYTKKQENGDYGELKVVEKFDKKQFCKDICKTGTEKDFSNFEPVIKELKEILNRANNEA